MGTADVSPPLSENLKIQTPSLKLFEEMTVIQSELQIALWLIMGVNSSEDYPLACFVFVRRVVLPFLSSITHKDAMCAFGVCSEERLELK